ncbi:2Fe-2S iron-sulfur cluster-binding protein [Paraflavitalea speifideaquila]|uniref:2Fe-2S iron-sulfur cluster-binding protein n=1 Tax=Paraflavitalea speifideaquila TaxID=3076558 RepID=UPI0028E5486B|nr:2Fe-2S iron-sulfur cluster-binding protein [Paraflavitalea speifideiaquila]
MIYQNHDEQNIVYHEAIQQLKEQYPDRLIRIDLLSHPILPDLPHQRLNNGLLETLLNNLLPPSTNTRKPVPGNHDNQLSENSQCWFYTCGPASFMRMVQFTLRVMGVEEAYIRKENFTVETVPPPAFTLDPAPRTVLVKQGEKSYKFNVSYPATILQAALDQQIKLPYSCKGGRCSACSAHCSSGTVKMNMNEVLTEQDLEKGLILTCVGYAVTDLVLEL